MLRTSITQSARCAGAATTSGRPFGAAAAAATAGRRPGAVTAGAVAEAVQTLTITRPDDWHLHVRDGQPMRAAIEYGKRISAAVPAGVDFTPLMTLYLTDRTTPEEKHLWEPVHYQVYAAKAAGCVAFKLYPAGATTNSDSGVTDLNKPLAALKAMAEAGVLLLVHGEVTDPEVDMFDREAVFITQKLADFVASAPANVAATITPQHMLMNRNALFAKGLRPHNYCLPILKREKHREAIMGAAVSGSRKFFLGTDSAPHPKHAKESSCGCAGMFSAPVALAIYATAFEKAQALDKLEGFASFHGPDFYGLPRNTDKLTLVRSPQVVPEMCGTRTCLGSCSRRRLVNRFQMAAPSFICFTRLPPLTNKARPRYVTSTALPPPG
eukprot:XP_001699489.1 dihydroorotase [Chlamydomonas reinhardtii]